MSINFSEDIDHDQITTAASLPEDRAEGSCAPSWPTGIGKNHIGGSYFK